MSQQTTTTSTLKSYADIGTEFEEIQCSVKTISDLLIVYEEDLTAELRGLKENPEALVNIFLNRQERLFSILWVLNGHIDDIIARLGANADTAYRVWEAMRQ